MKNNIRQEHFVGWLDAARRDFNIGIIWLVAVILLWSFKLSRTHKQNEEYRAA